MSTDSKLKKGMGVFDLTLFSVCAVLVVDTLTASASIGPSAITWWLLTLVFFVVPYVLITSELGTTYPGEGGIYDWVKSAYGNSWAVRTTWFYWVNVGLWMPAVYIMFAGMIAELFFPNMGLWLQIIIGIIATWVTVWICSLSVEEGKWVPNLGALAKILVILVLALGGFWYASKNGMANEFTIQSMMPNLDSGLKFLPAIVFNLLGFELVCCMGSSIRNPARDVPKSMIMAALVVTVLYILGTTGILMALPVDEIGLVGGIVETLRKLFGSSSFGAFMVIFIGIIVLFTFITNMVTWSMGACRAAAEAAQEGELTPIFGKMDEKRGTPIGATILLGIVSTVVILAYGFIASSSDDLFWTIFAFSSVIFLFPYVFMFPAFLKLRKIDPNAKRPFKLSGGNVVAFIAVAFGLFFVIQAIILFVFPDIFSGTVEWITYSGPVLLGIIITVAIGEYFVITAKSRMKE